MGTKRSGFAVLSQARRTEIATLGGLAVQAKGYAHRWTAKTGRIAVNTRWTNSQIARKAKAAD